MNTFDIERSGNNLRQSLYCNCRALSWKILAISPGCFLMTHSRTMFIATPSGILRKSQSSVTKATVSTIASSCVFLMKPWLSCYFSTLPLSYQLGLITFMTFCLHIFFKFLVCHLEFYQQWNLLMKSTCTLVLHLGQLVSLLFVDHSAPLVYFVFILAGVFLDVFPIAVASASNYRWASNNRH